MFEYDKETLERLLKIEEFDLEEIELDKIKHVPMHQYRVSTQENPYLLVENLQVCIGLYAYSKDFAYAAHINPVVMRGDEFILDENKNIKYCNRVEKLYEEIIKAKIKDNVYVGVSIGCNPVSKTYEVVYMLNELINELIIKLKNNGISIVKLELENNHVFIVDSKNENIITPTIQKIK